MVGLLIHAAEQGFAYGIAALGVFLTYRVLKFPDLTVDGSFVTGAAVASLLLVRTGIDPFSVLLVAFAAGCCAGLVTGLLNTKLGITNLLAGVLTMIMLYSINLRIMGRPNLSLLRATTTSRIVSAAWSPLGNLAILAFIGLVALAIKLGLDYFLRTEAGFALRATGDSEQMITTQGVNVNTMKLLGLALSNGLVALSGALVAQYSGFADVGMGIGTIVTGLAAVILGGALIRSKRVGWMTASVLLGSMIYRIAVSLALRYGYVVGFQASDLKLITSLLVIVALVVPYLRERRLRKVPSC
ncbi:ABC transporter permease [Candidatus Bipolaricaulota bacterium]|jgi:putative ABC transport system permease protein|nr:ABC transporter permease [Candidatus Bipolaricaulota bacterium]TFH09554.1 MAG: ABC transporter permease [Candidatus Atribacteria bacterium]